MNNTTQNKQDELVQDVLQFAKIFERLSSEDKAIMLEFLRFLNGVE